MGWSERGGSDLIISKTKTPRCDGFRERRCWASIIETRILDVAPRVLSSTTKGYETRYKAVCAISLVFKWLGTYLKYLPKNAGTNEIPLLLQLDSPVIGGSPFPQLFTLFRFIFLFLCFHLFHPIPISTDQTRDCGALVSLARPWKEHLQLGCPHDHNASENLLNAAMGCYPV